jgi:hypothetical protein
MRWHKEGIRDNDGVMGHPSDGEAWKVLKTSLMKTLSVMQEMFAWG